MIVINQKQSNVASERILLIGTTQACEIVPSNIDGIIVNDNI